MSWPDLILFLFVHFFLIDHSSRVWWLLLVSRCPLGTARFSQPKESRTDWSATMDPPQCQSTLRSTLHESWRQSSLPVLRKPEISPRGALLVVSIHGAVVTGIHFFWNNLTNGRRSRRLGDAGKSMNHHLHI